MDAKMLLALCEQKIKDEGDFAMITLALPFEASGFKARLFKTFGPIGTVMPCAHPHGKTNTIFMCKAITRYLKKEGVQVSGS